MNKIVCLLALCSVLPLYGNSKVFHDKNGNGKQDSGETGIPGVYVSNGQEIAVTSADGSYAFKTKGYWVSVTTPDKYTPTTPIWSDKNCSFGFQDDANYKDGAVFIHGSDIQFPVTRKRGILSRIAKKIAAAAEKYNTKSVICVGDITTHGDLADMNTVRDEFALNKLQFYPVFGGHDGVNSRDLGNYRKVFGPLWYSWNYRGVHFAAFVSENFLTKQQKLDQDKWLKEDLSKVPQDMPIVLATHAPGQMSRDLRQILAGREPELILRGHFHNWNIRKAGKTHVICSAPWREGDNGVQSIRVRVIKRENNNWKSFTESVHPLDVKELALGKAEIKTAENSGARVFDKELKKLVPVWSSKVGGMQDYYGSPVISDGKIYCSISDADIGAENAGVAALDAATGKVLWKTSTKDDIVSTPVVDGDFVYAASCQGDVFALKKSDGSIVWKTPGRTDFGNINNQTMGKYGWRVTTTSLVCGDGRIFTQSNIIIRALDMKTGKELWQIIRDSGYSPAAGVLFHDGKLYTAIPKQILVLDPATGKSISVLDKKKLTKVPFANDRGIAAATVYGGNIYFPGQVLRKFSSDCKELWAVSLKGSRYGVSSAVESNGVTLVAYNNLLNAYDSGNGKLLWSIKSRIATGEGAKNTSTPLVFKDKIVYASDTGVLSVCDLKTGKTLQSIAIGSPIKSSPAASGNLICVSTFDGRIIGFAVQ